MMALLATFLVDSMVTVEILKIEAKREGVWAKEASTPVKAEGLSRF